MAGLHPTLTPALVQDYYLQPYVAESIRRQTAGKAVSFRVVKAGGDVIFRRNLTAGEREVLQHIPVRVAVSAAGTGKCFIEEGLPAGYFSWGYWVGEGIVEVHVETCRPLGSGRAAMTDRVVVDLDPEGDLALPKLVEAADRSLTLLDRYLPLKALEVRYSGNRSLHLIGHLPYPQEVSLLRVRLKQLLIGNLPSFCSLRQQVDQESYLYVDLGAMGEGHTLRCLGSLHHKSGKACVRLQEPKEINEPEVGTLHWVRDYPERVSWEEK